MMNVLIGIHCVVPGCANTFKQVNQWKSRPCSHPKHKGKVHEKCGCPEPYQFFKFPTEVKLRKIWLERVKRKDLEVNNLTRVCSFHFVEGRPTRRHYFPDINLRKNQNNVVEFADEDEDKDDEMDTGNKSAALSIIPMELLREKGDAEDVVNGDGHLSSVTISRVSSTAKNSNGAGNTHVLRGRKRRMEKQNENDESSDCPFDIEMVGGDDDDDDSQSSELSDEIEMIECTPLTGVKTVKNVQLTKSDARRSRPSNGVAVVNTSTNNSPPKPKVLPVLVVTSKSQKPTTSFQPIITKVNSAAPSTQVVPSRPAIVSTTSHSASTSGNVQKPPTPALAVVATNGTTPVKPLATYDPSKQQLQIADPVKYIQDCHNRIAELLAEKNKIETKYIELDAKYRQVIARNRQLEAKVKELEEQKASTPNSNQQLATPTFNLIPSLAQGITISRGGVVSSATITNGSTTTPGIKRRFIQVIRN